MTSSPRFPIGTSAGIAKRQMGAGEAVAPARVWQTARFLLRLQRPLVMGIVNVTPDSFSDGGRHASESGAIAQCERLVEQGADILDLGGESSRPGAASLPLDEERRRVVPVLKAVLRLGVPISVDTYKPELMREVLDLGADIINDIHALGRPGAVEAVAAHPQAGVCLMHMQGAPATMQERPRYDDVVAEVKGFLSRRSALLVRAGIDRQRIAIDPGIGFGKSVDHNLSLLARQRELLDLGQPLLVGWSRKSTLGTVTGRDVGRRGPASLAAAVLAAERGADVIRVHDVEATVDALEVWQAIHTL